MFGDLTPRAPGVMNPIFGSSRFLLESRNARAATSETFSNIPQNFNHLLIEIIGQISTQSNIGVQLNGVTTGYDSVVNQGSGGSIASGTSVNTSTTVGPVLPSNGTASPGYAYFFFPFYTQNAFNKHVFAEGGGIAQSSVNNWTGTYTASNRSTAAITSITVISVSGFNYVAGTKMILYGLF